MRCCMLASCLRARPRTHGCIAPSAHPPAALQALATAALLPRLKELVLWQHQQPDVAPLPLPAALAGAPALETLNCGYTATTTTLPACPPPCLWRGAFALAQQPCLARGSLRED